jgi:hypothetical protein
MSTPVVRFSQSVTLNLGNYEATRIEVGVDLPVPAGSTPDETLAQAVQFVERHLDAQVKEALDTPPKPGPRKVRRK